MMKKNDFPRVQDFPVSDKERVKYAIEVIHKVIIMREGVFPVTAYISIHGEPPSDENSMLYRKWAESSDQRLFPLVLYFYTRDSIEVRYLWTAAVILGFQPEDIRCAENERSLSNWIGSYIWTSPYDQSGQIHKGDFTDMSLAVTKFRPIIQSELKEFYESSIDMCKRQIDKINEEKEDRIRELQLQQQLRKEKIFEEKSSEELAFKQRKEREQLLKQERLENERAIEYQARLKMEQQKRELEEQEKFQRIEKEKIWASEGLIELMSQSFVELGTVILLLKKGAYINFQDDKGFTPLIKSVVFGHDAIAEFLLQQGADPLIKTYQGKIASDFAIHSTPLCQLLKQKERDSLLEKFVPRDRFSELLLEAVAVFDITERKTNSILDGGADVNYQDQDGFTALILAVDNDNEGIAEYILRCGADPLLKNKNGKTARDYASRNSGIYGVLMGYELIFFTQAGDLKSLETLLNSDNTIVNFRCHRGYTALLIAVEKNLFEEAKFLLAKGADISMLRPDGLGVFDLTENREMLVLLKLAAIEQGFELENAEITGESSNNLINESNRFFSDPALGGKDQKEVAQPIAEVALHASESVQIDNDSGIIFSLNKGADVNF